MYSLRWRFEDGKDGCVVGSMSDLFSVYFTMLAYYPNLKFALKHVTGLRAIAVWFREETRIPPELGG